MKKLLRDFHKAIGKEFLIFTGICMSLGAFCMLIINEFWISLFIGAAAFLFFVASADEYDESYTPPFFHSVDENGNMILTNGEKTASVDEEGNIKSDAPLTASEQLDIVSMHHTLELSELDDDDYDDYDDDEYDDEDYENKKKDLRRRLKYLKDLYEDDLIDEFEYEEKKRDILDEL